MDTESRSEERGGGIFNLTGFVWSQILLSIQVTTAPLSRNVTLLLSVQLWIRSGGVGSGPREETVAGVKTSSPVWLRISLWTAQTRPEKDKRATVQQLQF